MAWGSVSLTPSLSSFPPLAPLSPFSQSVLARLSVHRAQSAELHGGAQMGEQGSGRLPAGRPRDRSHQLRLGKRTRWAPVSPRTALWCQSCGRKTGGSLLIPR